MKQKKDGTLQDCPILKENEELKKDKEWLDNINNEQTVFILELQQQIEQLSNDNYVFITAIITQKKQIKKMKNCKNCSYGMNGGCDYYNAVPDKVQNCEHWRLAE